MSRNQHIVNVDDLEWETEQHGDKFEFKRKWFSSRTGAQKLGSSLYKIPPGKTGFPFHKHFSNEEAIYVLSGNGKLRLDDEDFVIGPGDYIALPPGGPNHQLLNTGTEDLEYICISTMIHPDITLFPDSNKVIAFAGSGPGGDKGARTFNGIYKADSSVGYYDDEQPSDFCIVPCVPRPQAWRNSVTKSFQDLHPSLRAELTAIHQQYLHMLALRQWKKQELLAQFVTVDVENFKDAMQVMDLLVSRGTPIELPGQTI